MDPTQNAAPKPTFAPPSHYFNNSIFWIEVEKIVPNPYQPRREFDPHALKDLGDSIRMYGLLQPLVVTRNEIVKDDGGLAVRYELISGERRLRASKLAGLLQVPVIIRAGEEDARVKLELAIIENLQREDLNAVDRARSFQRLADEFGMKHVQIAEKMGKSREYVTNTIRLLALPPHMLDALSQKKITEGHTRPLLMLVDRPEEQETLFKEIVFRRITVREAESSARRVAVDRARKKDITGDPELREFEDKLNHALGTRVMIEKKEHGGKIVIDFFSNEDLRHLLDMINKREGGMVTPAFKMPQSMKDQMDSVFAATPLQAVVQVPEVEGSTVNGTANNSVDTIVSNESTTESQHTAMPVLEETPEQIAEGVQSEPAPDSPIDDSTPSDVQEDEGLYSIKNFSI